MPVNVSLSISCTMQASTIHARVFLSADDGQVSIVIHPRPSLSLAVSVQVCLAYRHDGGKVVVVLSQRPKLEMEALSRCARLKA